MPQIEFVRVIREAGRDANGDYSAGAALIRIDGDRVETATNEGETAAESAVRWVRDVYGIELVPAAKHDQMAAFMADIASATKEQQADVITDRTARLADLLAGVDALAEELDA